MDAGEWYIEVNGRKVGPFTLDQVQGLLDDGEIRHYHQVTSVLTGGQWISVKEALEGALQSPQAPPSAIPNPDQGLSSELGAELVAEPGPVSVPAATTEFSPPPRPEFSIHPTVIADQNDPATSLFDALQVEKERRTTIGPFSARKGSKKPLFRVRKVAAKLASVKQVRIVVPLTPRMFWTAILAGLVLGSLTYAVMRAFKHHAIPTSGSFTPLTRTITPEQTSPEKFQFHHEIPAQPLARPTFPVQQHRRTIPPPPPAHVAVPPHFNGPSGNNEPYRDREQNQQQDNGNGYPPQDNNYPPGDNSNGENPDGQNQQQNPQQNQQQNQQAPNQQNPDDQQPGDPNDGGQQQQNPNRRNFNRINSNRQNPQNSQDGDAQQNNATGQDSFQPVQGSEQQQNPEQ